jgi:hypothetical protein
MIGRFHVTTSPMINGENPKSAHRVVYTSGGNSALTTKTALILLGFKVIGSGISLIWQAIFPSPHEDRDK